MTNVGIWLDVVTGGLVSRLRAGVRRWMAEAAEESGQGTTEYAVLIGVLVIVAIFAIILLRQPIIDLWDNIIENMRIMGEKSGEDPFA